MKKVTLKNSREYTAFFEENELGGYTITVPALPGLVTEAKDIKHAKTTFGDAIICYVESLKKEGKTKAAIPYI